MLCVYVCFLCFLMKLRKNREKIIYNTFHFSSFSSHFRSTSLSLFPQIKSSKTKQIYLNQKKLKQTTNNDVQLITVFRFISHLFASLQKCLNLFYSREIKREGINWFREETMGILIPLISPQERYISDRFWKNKINNKYSSVHFISFLSFFLSILFCSTFSNKIQKI